MNKSNLKPTGDKIIVKVVAMTDVTAKGVHIPDQAKERPLLGEVIAVGPGLNTVKMSIKVGDNVLFGKYCGQELRLIEDDNQYLIMREGETYAITNIERVMTGIDLIAEERREQIEKHGWNPERDAKYYSNGELLQAALFCISPTACTWPEGWDEYFKNKIINNSRTDQLKKAGAFIAAEIDRMRKLIESALNQVKNEQESN